MTGVTAALLRSPVMPEIKGLQRGIRAGGGAEQGVVPHGTHFSQQGLPRQDTGERERGKETGSAGGGEGREGQEGRGDTAVS